VGNESTNRCVFAAAILCVIIVALGSQFAVAPESRGQVAKVTAYLSHDPILIVGNAQFTSANGVTGGTGTASDPYVIEGWDINATSATGILIQNTTVRFDVRSCFVHDGSAVNSGIVLRNCANGTLSNNNCSTNANGIYVWSSSGVTLINNNCSSNSQLGVGIELYSSDGNILSNNTCSDNGVGIGLWFSEKNTLDNNALSGNSFGLALVSAGNNSAEGNNCSANSENGISLNSSTNDTLRDNVCVGDSSEAIYLGWTDNSTLSGNICSESGHCGIFLEQSIGNTLILNQLRDNGLYGLDIESGSSSNVISNNTFMNNNGAGSTYDPSHVQAIDNGTGNLWNSTKGYGNYWGDWRTPDRNRDGVVDSPYAIDGNAGVEDSRPLTTIWTQIPEFGAMPFVAIVLLATIMSITEGKRRKAH
jgi:parallel beta-helix repeat protein